MAPTGNVGAEDRPVEEHRRKRQRTDDVLLQDSCSRHAEDKAVHVDPSASTQAVAARRESWSSGVPFFPPSEQYWRIGGKWYDFTAFLPLHPGGAQALLLARDRFEDATFVFESHHHNYKRARAIIRKYEVPEELAVTSLQKRPSRGAAGLPSIMHFDSAIDGGKIPKLASDESFYSVLRQRVTLHLKNVGYPHGGPTPQCICLFWGVFLAWTALMYATWATGYFCLAFLTAYAGALLGAFGHNWVHQSKYKRRGWALLSLDTIGFSSEGWYREHNMQHHMYTNTPWDNHFKGTDPFLTTDPTVHRGFMQRWITPYLNPLILCFGVYGNYIAHTVELLQGHEQLSIGKTFLPIHIGLMISRWGLMHGIALCFIHHGTIGVYYFTMALMNHNAEHCVQVRKRNAARDWGEAQLLSSADWGLDLSFLQAARYLWLNFHTVHHLFPRIDFSHHPAIQQILVRTCDEFGIEYAASESPLTIYRQMIHTFSEPVSLFQEILVNAGGV